MKKYIFSAILLLGFIRSVTAFPLATNAVWSIPNGMNPTDYVAQITADGTFRVAGTVTANSTNVPVAATSAATVGALTIQTNATVGGNLTVTGTVTLGSAPAFPTAGTQTGTPVVAAGITLPQGYSTNANKLITISIGGTNYVIPAFVKP